MDKKRVLVIGDIHGNAKGLQQVLDKCKWNPKTDKIIQLGDVADGWSETSECVDILLRIKKESIYEPVFIRGNHDVWVYDWMMFGKIPILWTQQGGQTTLDNYVATGKLVDKDHKNFWFTQKDWYIDDENRLFIHAGWDYTADDFPKSASYPVNAGSIAKECHWDRSIFQDTATMQFMREERKQFDAHKKTEKALNKFKEVYIGHTALKNSEVYNYMNLWNMDSGSGWHGRLAIMDIDTKEVWYSDYSKDLYPEEKGRG